MQNKEIIVEYLDINDPRLIPNPKNPNKHPESQINAFVKILEYQGWRLPIVVSNQTKFMATAHARLLAAKKMGMDKVPVSFQNFKDWDQEYSFMVSDNSMADQSEIDLSLVNAELENLGPDLDLDNLGIKDFNLEPSGENDSQKQYFVRCAFSEEQKAIELMQELESRGFKSKVYCR